MGICDGRVCIVTGAGRGIGREHSLILASQGAKVVVNDLGGEMDGSGRHDRSRPGRRRRDRGRRWRGGRNGDDISDWEGSQRLINQAVETFGGLDVVINNAGILRDRMLTNMTEEEWDAVIKVHLKGTFGPSRWAAAYWRERSKAGETNDGRIINTTSPSGIYGNVGQTNYGAAKAGIAAFTIIAAKELARYGVTVNAIAPAALTRMTENLGMGQADEETKERLSPAHIAPIVCWLASPESKDVTGRVFDVTGQALSVSEGWHRGPTEENPTDDPTKLGDVVKRLVERGPAQRQHVRLRREARGPAMPINPDAVGAKGDPVEHSWTSKDALLYAVGVGAGAVDPLRRAGLHHREHQRRPAAGAADDGRRARLRRCRRRRQDRLVQPGDARPRRAGHRAALAHPRRRARSRRSARSPASTTRARAR